MGGPEGPPGYTNISSAIPIVYLEYSSVSFRYFDSAFYFIYFIYSFNFTTIMEEEDHWCHPFVFSVLVRGEFDGYDPITAAGYLIEIVRVYNYYPVAVAHPPGYSGFVTIRYGFGVSFGFGERDDIVVIVAG